MVVWKWACQLFALCQHWRQNEGWTVYRGRALEGAMFVRERASQLCTHFQHWGRLDELFINRRPLGRCHVLHHTRVSLSTLRAEDKWTNCLQRKRTMRLPCFVSCESELFYAVRWRCVDKLFMGEENCEDTVFAIVRKLACQHCAPQNCLQRKRANREGTTVAWERACQVCAQCWHWEQIHG